MTNKTITYQHLGEDKKVRGSKLGEVYDKGGIEIDFNQRIKEQEQQREDQARGRKRTEGGLNLSERQAQSDKIERAMNENNRNENVEPLVNEIKASASNFNDPLGRFEAKTNSRKSILKLQPIIMLSDWMKKI